MRGISASGASADSQINWSLGKTGRLEGAAQKSFIADGASVAGVGLNRRLFDGWQIGAQTWALKGDDGSIDPSLATAFHYTTGVSNHDKAFPEAGCAAVDSCARGTRSSIWLALNKEW